MTCPTACQQTASCMRNRHDILQKALNISASWSTDWKLDIYPTKSDHLPIGNSPHFVTYILPSHNPPNAQTISTVTTTKDLGIALNTKLSAEDNVVSAANKANAVSPETTRRGPYPKYFSPAVQNVHPSTS